MTLDAHGVRVELPAGWSGRVFARAAAGQAAGRRAARLHAGNFPLVLGDGEFGDRSTGVMPVPGAFIALAEYLPGKGLEPGRGLFASGRIPLPLDPTAFGESRLAHPRPDQVGTQHFFTASGRPLCLYVVVAGGRRERRLQLAAVDHVLRTLRVAPAAVGAQAPA